MKKAKGISTQTVDVVTALVLLIAGVLFCISSSLGEKWVNVILGVGVLLIGLIEVIGDFLKKKCLITRDVIVGSAIAALGVYLLVDGGVVSRIIGLLPYLLIAAGACVFADAFLLKFVRDKKNTVGFVLELVIGVALIVFGVLMLTVGAFKRALGLIFGIVLILYAFYLLIDLYSSKKAKSETKK